MGGDQHHPPSIHMRTSKHQVARLLPAAARLHSQPRAKMRHSSAHRDSSSSRSEPYFSSAASSTSSGTRCPWLQCQRAGGPQRQRPGAKVHSPSCQPSPAQPSQPSPLPVSFPAHVSGNAGPAGVVTCRTSRWRRARPASWGAAASPAGPPPVAATGSPAAHDRCLQGEEAGTKASFSAKVLADVTCRQVLKRATAANCGFSRLTADEGGPKVHLPRHATTAELACVDSPTQPARGRTDRTSCAPLCTEEGALSCIADAQRAAPPALVGKP